MKVAAGLLMVQTGLGLTTPVEHKDDDKFAISGAKIGTTLNIRKPPRFVGRLGDNLATENVTETQVPLVLDTLFGVDVEFSSIDRTLSLDDYSRRILKPQLATIANKIDFDILQKYKEVYNQVGSPGTVPSAFSTYLDASVKLNNEAAPIDDERYAGLTPRMEGTIVNAALAYFNPQNAIADQYRKGRMGMFGGFEFFMDQNMPSHTAATQSGSVTVSGAVSSGSTVVLAGITTTGLKKGDVMTFSTTNRVNPQSRQSNAQLAQFAVAADTGADSGGALTVTITPEIVVSGPSQNVDAAIGTGATVAFESSTGRTYPIGMAWHRDWCTLACADLELPRGVHEAARVSDKQLGLSIRMVTAFDIRTNKMITRLDILYGIAVLYPELCCRIAS